MEVVDEMNAAESLMERLNAAASLIEQAAERLASLELASLELKAGQGAREEELEQRLFEAEKTIATLKASGRKTVAGGATSLVAKEGGSIEAGAVDAALGSLSVEQRIAVKAGLMRAGLVG